MRKFLPIILSVFLLCQFNFEAHAQLPPGSTAPDWTLTDINGNSHNLYSMLNAGKYVYIEVSATWCGPCWNFHNTGVMESIYNDYGPNGTDEARVFFIEGDLGTSLNCLFGNCSNTIGNWVAGTSFPFINLTNNNGPGFTSDYQINYFPTIYVVCPDKRIYETGQADLSTMESYMQSCDMSEESVETTEEVCFNDGNGSIDMTVQGGVLPIEYNWSNGQNTEDLSGITAGNYTLTMTDGNNVSYSTSVTLGGPTADLSIEESQVNLQIDCNGNNNGVIHVDPLGGVPSYTASWDDGNQDLHRNSLAAGTYSITVSDQNGCTETSSYTVTEPAELTLSLGKLDASCGLANGFIAAESDGGTGQHAYDIGQGITYDPLFEDLPAGNYTVTLTDDNNCSKTASIDIVNIPGPEAEAPASLQMNCEGNSIVIDASSSTVTSGTDILWTTNDGNIISGETTLMPTVDASGTYTLTLSNAQTCNDEAETVITLNPDQPVADAGQDQEVNCNTPVATIGSDNSSSGPNIEYEWFDEDSNKVGTTQFIDVANAGEYTLYVTNTDIMCTTSANVSVDDTGGGVEAVGVAEGKISCKSDVVTLESNGSTIGDDIVLSWRDAEGNEISVDPSVEVNVSGEYTLVVTDTSLDCSSEEVIVVEEDKEAPEILAEGDTLSCEQTEIQLNASVNNYDGDVAIVWRNEAGDIVGQEATINVTEVGNYTVEITNEENGCSAVKTVEVSKDEDLPSVVVDQPDILSCALNEVVLDGSASSQGDDLEYQWTSPEGNIVGPANGPTVTVDKAGNYTLVITNTENGCQNMTTIEVNSYDEVPAADLLFDLGNLNVSTNADTEGFPYEVKWDFGDGTTSNDLEAFHRYTKRGHYEICLTLINDCGETTICQRVYIGNNGGVVRDPSLNDGRIDLDQTLMTPFYNKDVQKRSENISSLDRFSVYPVPASDVLYLDLSLEREMDIEIRIVDISGKLVHQARYQSGKVLRERMNISDWNQGMYMIQLITREGSEILQMIKQ
jgi:hypothetical protein